MPSMPRLFILPGLALAMAAAGCAEKGTGLAERPRSKPEVLTAQAATPNRGRGEAPLTLARVSTKSGEILILEPDGSVTTMELDLPGGRDAFAATQVDLSSLDFGGAVIGAQRGGRGAVARKTAQEQAIEAFAARTQPALPEWREGTVVDEADFIGTRVQPIRGEKGADLVEVTANLREGVDADIAFSYATCALAGWAKSQGTSYARHIRTLQDERDGKLLIGAAFTLSDSQPLGLRVMETNETLRECKARGIPAA